eukprot:tig00021111_g18384.t2
MLKDECDARYTTDDATAKAARQRCDHSEPESGACQWTEDSIHIHPARLLELITPATRTRKHEPYAVVKLESQEWWTEFRTTLFLPPWERDWDYEADPSAQPQPPSGYKQRRPPLEHFLIDPEPLADPFWNLVAQELRREELPAARPPRVAATDASTTGFGSEAALTAYAGVWTRDHEQNAAHSPADRQREAQRRSEEDDAPQAAALRELAEAIPTDGSDFFVAPCPGTVNNNKGELLAVLTAFLKSPEGCTVKTDSSTAMSLIRRSVLHRADSTSPRRRRRKATRREPETDSDADDSGSYVSYLSAPDDLPPSPLTPSLSPNSARDKGSHPSNVRPARRAGRNASAVETRSRLSGPTFPPSPASRSPNAWRGGARPAPLRPVLQGRSRSRIRPRRLGCRKTCMASTASLEGYDSSRAYRVESDPRAHVRAVCEMRNFVRLTSLESSWLGAPADRARLAREFRKQGASRDASAPFNARLAQLTKFSMELAPLLPVRARDAPHLYGNINPQGLCVRPGCARVADASGGPIPAPPWAPRRDPGAAATADRDPPPALHSASQPETHDHAFGLCSASQAARLAMQSKIYNLLHTTITTQRLKSAATRPCTNARDPGLYPPPPCLSLRLPSRWLTHGQALFTDLSHDSPRLSVRLLLPRSLVPALEYLHEIWQARNSDCRQPAQPAHEPQSNLAIGRPSPQPVAPLPPSEEEVLRQISSPLLGTSGSINVTRRSLSRLNGRGPQRLHNKLVARGVSPLDFDVLLFPIHSPGHWTFAAIHSRLERSWPRFSAGSSSSAGNATFPQTTPPPGRLHRPPDALPQANGPQHPDPAPEADRRRQALPPD